MSSNRSDKTPAALADEQDSGRVRLGDSRSTRAETFLRQYLTYLRSSPRQGLRPRWCDVYEALEVAIDALSAQPSPGGQGDAPLRVFSAGRWTYDGTGQSFSHEDMDSAAFVVYRDAALAARQPVGQNWQHIANEWADATANGVQWLRNIRDGASTVTDALACMESNVERIRQLKPQPVGEPVAWMTHHDEPMLFPTAAEATAYCEDDEQPVPLFRSPAQAVDLGRFRKLASWVANCAGHGINDSQRRLGAELLAQIDSQAVGK